MKRNIYFLVLFCILLGCSTPVFAGYAKGKIVVKSAPVDREWGYVSVDGNKYVSVTNMREQSAEFTSKWHTGTWGDETVDITFYMSASATSGYYILGWGKTQDVIISDATNAQYTVTRSCEVPTGVKSVKTTDFGTYYAIFKPVEVTSPANGSTIVGATLEEPTGRAEHAQVRLSVKATRAEDFVVQITGNPYILYNSHSFDNGNLVIDYTYSAHNVDGTDEATITVTSAGGENAYTFTLVCKTSLIPTFTLSPSSVAFGETSIVGSKTENISPATSTCISSYSPLSMIVRSSVGPPSTNTECMPRDAKSCRIYVQSVCSR